MIKRIVILALVVAFSATGYLAAQNNEVTYGIGKSEYRRANLSESVQYDKNTKRRIKEALAQGEIELAKKHMIDYLDKKYFLPTYQELRSGSQGVSLEDWKLHLLSELTFERLDKDENGYLSEAELEGHELMGALAEYRQDQTDIQKACQDISDHKEKVRALQKMGYDLSGETYYLPKDHPQPKEVPLKTYVDVTHGELVVQELPLGEYARQLIQDMQYRESIMPYIFGVVLVLILAAGTVVLSKVL